MGYSITVSPRALHEMETAIDFYALNSNDAPKKFIAAIAQAYANLETNPNKRIRYKNIRAIALKKFPYLLYFVINKQQHTVRILSCFHYKRNPAKKP